MTCSNFPHQVCKLHFFRSKYKSSSPRCIGSNTICTSQSWSQPLHLKPPEHQRQSIMRASNASDFGEDAAEARAPQLKVGLVKDGSRLHWPKILQFLLLSSSAPFPNVINQLFKGKHVYQQGLLTLICMGVSKTKLSLSSNCHFSAK